MVFISFLFVATACSYKKKSSTTTLVDITVATTKKEAKTTEFKPYKLNADYTLVDTGTYTNEGPTSGGSFGIVKRGTIILDTIDLYYGMKVANDQSYLYQQLVHEFDPSIKETKQNLDLQPDAYMLIKGNNKTKLSSILSHFDDNFSSPGIINGKIYFWQLERTDSTGFMKVFAAEYDPLSKHIRSIFLLIDDPETDDSNYFTMPYSKNNMIVFTIDEKKKWKFSSDFKLINDVQH